MPALGDVLRRFRFHGVPGAPTVVAVPADRSAELESELAPIFASIDGAQRAARAVMTAAERTARQRRADAAAEGQRIVAAARAGIVAARDEAAAALLVQAELERRQVVEDGRAEAARVTRLSAKRVEAVAESVVARILVSAAEAGERPGS